MLQENIEHSKRDGEGEGAAILNRVFRAGLAGKVTFKQKLEEVKE